jgi:hypothetical protein
MALRVVGAGLGRTGTMSLKTALEQLLGGPCYHMAEVFGHPEHIPLWQEAADGGSPAWDQLFAGYDATVDWPSGAFWEPIAAANPDAVILLSTRSSTEAWWKSADATIFGVLRDRKPDDDDPWFRMWRSVARNTFTEDTDDAEASMAAYEKHNAHVRATADPARLVEWQPGDGWEPLCTALGVPVPDEAFPHLNTSEEWAERSRTRDH